MANYFKVDRKIVKWEWFTDSNTLTVWIYCLSQANWKPGRFMGHEIPRGSFATSVQHIATDCGLTNRNVRTSLEKLKNSENLTIKTTNKFSLISVVNYSKYQNSDEGTDKQSDNPLTNDRQTTDKQTDNNRSIKAFKQDNKITNTEDKRSCDSEKTSPSPTKLSTRFVKPTVQEIADYANSIGFTALDAEYFWNYYQSNGWRVGRNPMKDWRASIRTWRRNDQNKNKPRKEKLAF